jgi:hypothetical protein
LNGKHPKGGGKAKFFVAGLGIEPNDWRFLADQIERAMASAPIYRVDKNAWGFPYGALVLVTGRNGKPAVLETGWVIESGGPAKFVTAYPYDGDVSLPLVAPEPFVVDPNLSNDARWAAIYERAVTAGESAAQAAPPSPMIIHGQVALEDEKWPSCEPRGVDLVDCNDTVTGSQSRLGGGFC